MRNLWPVFCCGALLYGLLLSAAFWACSEIASAHSGGLDANGGHYNHKTGEYHYHRKGRVTANPDEDPDWSSNLPKSEPRKPAKSLIDTSFSKGNVSIHISTEDNGDVGSFHVVSTSSDWTGKKKYTIRYEVGPTDDTLILTSDVSEEEVMTMLEQLCDLLAQIREKK